MAQRKAETRRRPDMIPVGPSVRLVSLPAMATAFGVSEHYAKRFLDGLGVPCERVYGLPYFSMFALESTLFSKLLPDIYSTSENHEFGLYLQTVAALEYCAADAKAMKRRLSRIADNLVKNMVSVDGGPRGIRPDGEM